MNRLSASVCLLVLHITCFSQPKQHPQGMAIQHGPASVFSHNDYLQTVPFYAAYLSEVGYVEADIFLRGSKLLVAHTQEEISESHNLEDLYIRPLQAVIRRNKGRVFRDSSKVLTLMIDVKSDAATTLSALVTLLRKYSELTTCATLRITISGNRPAPEKWSSYPAFLSFDGRPGIAYTAAQLERVALISDSFASYSTWNGTGKPDASDASKVAIACDEAHAKGKVIRFWGTPDTPHAWSTFMRLGVDLINTDHPVDAVKYVSRFAHDNFQSTDQQTAYKPTRTFPSTAIPKNVILLIGDGTGLAQMYSGYTANHGSLSMFNMGTVGLVITTAANAYITDSAAGATALATGRKTNNRYIGVDSLGTPLPTMAEQLEQKGFHTAIASSGDITDATPACFYAHQLDRGMREPIARDFLSSNVDILIGADRKSFLERTDRQNLFHEIQRKGYSVSEKLSSLDTINTTRFVIIDDAAGLQKSNGRGEFLTKAFKKASAMCVKSGQPFFMMFEGAQVDWGGHANELPYLATELLDFDALVGEAVKFAEKDGQTLVIVTADHETGGLSLLGGDFTNGSVRGGFSTGGHTAIPVPVFAFGPGAHIFTGVYQNTEIYHKVMQLLNKTSGN